ncbi:hypothetical protein P152DRAFT_109990 [Eremomyces bilateralis CBS 781.70]|uniref:Uncharacterized protein n=1 Tax=Eremomyces bilateralis CBS 781.70 TaxID=1392243 RepID=A0A6G1GDT6_9PEZI|nr:uncharacterized protein P152DRAFT_109990 [Eremomyces bilateralis CBS 781.70]KAF1816070.1 hypothetical protein P152DRAFT_109990 [Eremomyces bilateralis CBS 781.70]
MGTQPEHWNRLNQEVLCLLVEDRRGQYDACKVRCIWKAVNKWVTIVGTFGRRGSIKAACRFRETKGPLFMPNFRLNQMVVWNLGGPSLGLRCSTGRGRSGNNRVRAGLDRNIRGGYRASGKEEQSKRLGRMDPPTKPRQDNDGTGRGSIAGLQFASSARESNQTGRISNMRMGGRCRPRKLGLGVKDDCAKCYVAEGGKENALGIIWAFGHLGMAYV